MPTIPTSMAPLIDEYMKRTGQTTDTPTGMQIVEAASFAAVSSRLHRDDISGRKPDKRDMVKPAFDGVGTWTIPVWLASEANAGGKMRAAIGRKQAVKKAVWRALGEHWKVWGPAGDRVRAGQSRDFRDVMPEIRVVRLGGRGLDYGNLWRACKPVEDALAILMGCDDGWTAWQEAFSVHQEPGPLWGCRIIVRIP